MATEFQVMRQLWQAPCWHRGTWIVAGCAVASTVWLAWLARSEPLWALGVACWMGMACAIAVVDVQEHRIPNRMVAVLAAGTTAGLIAEAFTTGDWAHSLGSIGAGLAGSAIALVVHVISRGGLGMGDVKLMFPVVALLGRFGVDALFTAYAVGVLAMSVALGASLVVRRQRRDVPLALGPYLVGGTAVALAMAMLEV